MIFLREYNFTEIEKTELISQFLFPEERLKHVRGSFFDIIFPLYNVTSRFVEPLRNHISRRQLLPKKQYGENEPLTCLNHSV